MSVHGVYLGIRRGFKSYGFLIFGNDLGVVPNFKTVLLKNKVDIFLNELCELHW